MSHIRVEQTERIAWLTLDCPPLNILSIEMMKELGEAIDGLAENDGASVVVLDSVEESRGFCAGIDMTEHTLENIEEVVKTFHQVVHKLVQLPQVTVAAIDGAALGGGLELALACDLVVASARSEVGFPEITIGAFPPIGLSLLPRICSRPVASDLILSGEPLVAADALRAGLVSRVFPNNGFAENLRVLVAGLAERSPAVLRLTTKTLRKHVLYGVDNDLTETEEIYINDLAKLPDLAEGFKAFLEKRKPEWDGA